MIHLHVILDGEGIWPDLIGRQLPEVKAITIAGLGHGLTSGKASVAIRIDLASGEVIVAQTTLTLFMEAAHLLGLRYNQHVGDD